MSESRTRKITFLWIGISAFAIVIDQISKYYAAEFLSPVDPVSVFHPYFDLILVYNNGAAFGFMSTLGCAVRTALFSIISIGAVFLLYYLFRTRPVNSILAPVAIGLVAGGAVGNFIDRIRFGSFVDIILFEKSVHLFCFGHVVDFLDFHIGRYHWPTFNLADSCITIGVGLLLIQLLMEDKHHAS